MPFGFSPRAVLFVFLIGLLISCGTQQTPEPPVVLTITVFPASAEVKITGSGLTTHLSTQAAQDDTKVLTYHAPPGLLQLEAQASGYHPLTEQLVLRARNSYSLALRLTPSEVMPPQTKTIGVDAGEEQTITLPKAALLEATAYQQGFDSPLSFFWSVSDGPAEVTFSAPNRLVTEVAFTLPGNYTLELRVSAEGATAKDSVRVTVLGEETGPSPAPGDPSSPPPGDAPPPTPTPAPPSIEPNAYYVAPDGQDRADGSFYSPFQTVQHCAQVVQPGESCILRAGVYREEVRPANSGRPGQPITFKSYPGETAVISGADLLTGWTRHEGDIYKTALPWTLGEGNDQVFVDGRMMNEARWPNASLDVSRPTWAYTESVSGSGSSWTLRDATLPRNLVGAKINIGLGGTPGSAWIVQTGTITSASGGQLGFTPSPRNFVYAPTQGKPYFLWGKYELLDSSGEWFASTDTLYLWTDASDDPTNRAVEAKRRNYAFRFGGRSHIVVQNLSLFAATVETDPQSSSIVIDGIRGQYLSHFTKVLLSWTEGVKDTGIILHGNDHTLKNSHLSYSAGNGVSLHGHNHTVTNNVIHDIGYAASDTAAVTTSCIVCSGTSTGHEVSYNTLFNAGRSVLVHRKTQAARIIHNEMFSGGLQMDDLGITYTYQTDGGGTVIAYNLIHSNHAKHLGLGIYLDNGSSNFIVHNNVVWDVHDALRLNLPSINNLAFNNTLIARHRSIDYWGPSGSEDMRGTRLFNNLANQTIRFNYGAVAEANLQTLDPRFVAAQQQDYRLRSDSPAIDQGRVVAGYTNGYVGSAPDIGAYEHGGAVWNAGSNLPAHMNGLLSLSGW